MNIQQISVFLENRPGTMAAFTKLLQKNEIDLRALSLAETENFGIVRVITDDPMRTVQVLKDEGYICSLTPVVAVAIEDKPGALATLLDTMADAGINLEYTYAFLAKKANSACIAFRVTDNEAASKLLAEKGIKTLGQEDLPALFE